MKKGLLQFLAVTSIVASFALLGGGCAKQATTTDEGMAGAGEEVGAGAGAGPDVAEVAGIEESLEGRDWAVKSDTFLEGRTSAPMLPVYFDFDKSSIRADQQDRIKTNGGFLIDNAGISIRIEGNCDERGTEEYNMALGERRAISAKNFLMNMGVAANRLETISYGEEKPINYGHDELAWSQNRRDDFVIIK